MEKDFFELYLKHPLLRLEVYHSSICDWSVTVFDKRGCDMFDPGNQVLHVDGPHVRLFLLRLTRFLLSIFAINLTATNRS